MKLPTLNDGLNSALWFNPTSLFYCNLYTYQFWEHGCMSDLVRDIIEWNDKNTIEIIDPYQCIIVDLGGIPPTKPKLRDWCTQNDYDIVEHQSIIFRFLLTKK